MKPEIRQFPLVWRWTQASHAVLPDSVLAQLDPVDAGDAADVDARHRAALSGQHLRADMFRPILHGNASGETASEFLAELGIADATPVCLSWDGATALRTTWLVFRQYWGDFCYPASDDVSIAPEDESWLLLYFHWEQFEFGIKKEHNQAPQVTSRKLAEPER